MNSLEELKNEMAAIDDAQLASYVAWEIKTLIRTSGRSFRMCVPVGMDDSDILLNEMLKRFKAAKGLT